MARGEGRELSTAAATARHTLALPATLARFARSSAFVRFIVGPVGSGKSSMCVTEILRRAAQQTPGPDGVRRSRFAVIRNTYGQLKDTTRKTFEEWIPQHIGKWNEQRFSFTMDFLHNDGCGNKHPVHCEVLFRALDSPDDVRKLLSLELTGAYINEAREIPKHVLDVLETRVGRYPSKKDGGATWFGIWADTNPWHAGHWGAKLFAKLGATDGYALFRQPGGRDHHAENVENLPRGYYDRLCTGKSKEWVRVYVDGEDASGDEGAVWGAWIGELQARAGDPAKVGGICGFEHPRHGVYTSWDLGRADSTAIWFWRIRDWMERCGDRFIPRRAVDVIDHYENHGQGIGHYLDVVDARGYSYVKHYLPHDSRIRRAETDQTALEKAIGRWGMESVGITPDISRADGIDAARWLLEQPTQIHERCGVATVLEYSGIDALTGYRFGWDDKGQCFTREPLHNWASHSADAFRYLAVVAKHAEIVTRPDDPPAEATRDEPAAYTFDDLMEERSQSRRWER